MKRLLLAMVVASMALPVPVAADQRVTRGLREQLRIHETLLEGELAAYQTERQKLEAAYLRMQEQVRLLLQAQAQGEGLESLRTRDEELRQAEAELMARMSTAQRLRQSILSSRAMMEATEVEIARLEQEYGIAPDPLTGTWRIVIEPGGLAGRMVLELDGTLVQGTYQLAGDWTGSMRGTYVSRKVRLERIDSQIGFAAIFYGRLVRGGLDARLEGTWEATQLASGLPSAGTWVAERITEPTE